MKTLKDVSVSFVAFMSTALLLFFRYLGSKAVKLFKVRMHGSDAVSTFCGLTPENAMIKGTNTLCVPQSFRYHLHYDPPKARSKVVGAVSDNLSQYLRPCVTPA